MTITMQHDWIMHQMTPVSVLDDGEGNPVVFVDPDNQNDSEQMTVYGCIVCGEALPGNIDTECKGVPDGED